MVMFINGIEILEKNCIASIIIYIAVTAIAKEMNIIKNKNKIKN
jgi:hypothetical protein